MNCVNCKYWDNSDKETSWNKQHQSSLLFPFETYGKCSSEKMQNHTFTDVYTFGNFTHKDFGCVFFKLLSNSPEKFL